MNLKNASVASVAVVVAAPCGMGALAAGKRQITSVKPSELKWGPTNPDAPPGGPQASILWGDPKKGPVGFFLKVAAGSDSGVHSHTSDYRAVVIQGSLTATETDDPKAEGLPAGSYYFQPGKQFHNNVCKSSEDCIIYIEFLSAGIDFFPKDKPVSAKSFSAVCPERGVRSLELACVHSRASVRSAGGTSPL